MGIPVVTPVAYPDSLGARHSWASIRAIVAGLPILGIKKCSYSRIRTREILHGTHPDPIGKTVGENAYKCSIDLYLAEYQQLKAALKLAALALGPNVGYGDIFFVVQVQYSAPGFATIQDEISGCTLDETNAEQSQGPAALLRGIELNPLKVEFDGDDDTTPLAIVASAGPGF